MAREIIAFSALDTRICIDLSPETIEDALFPLFWSFVIRVDRTLAANSAPATRRRRMSCCFSKVCETADIFWSYRRRKEPMSALTWRFWRAWRRHLELLGRRNTGDKRFRKEFVG
jgi:hypothetical protein